MLPLEESSFRCQWLGWHQCLAGQLEKSQPLGYDHNEVSKHFSTPAIQNDGETYNPGQSVFSVFQCQKSTRSCISLGLNEQVVNIDTSVSMILAHMRSIIHGSICEGNIQKETVHVYRLCSWTATEIGSRTPDWWHLENLDDIATRNNDNI